MTTITAREMREALGLSVKSVKSFNQYRSRYPHAFVVVKEGRAGNGGAALYDRSKFMKWLKRRNAALELLKGE